MFDQNHGKIINFRVLFELLVFMVMEAFFVSRISPNTFSLPSLPTIKMWNNFKVLTQKRGLPLKENSNSWTFMNSLFL